MAPLLEAQERNTKYYLETNFILKKCLMRIIRYPRVLAMNCLLFSKKAYKNWFSLADCAYFAIAKKPGILRFQ